ncbi:protein phosphatase regulator [Mycoemilia scoparia]|uniref:Protein phosphatase regulator n=1 Tax=Mycoemilia scoparia TaxID=417184 RepID=A0A9W7ZRQ0_9FUNG|nr:protein phosphatase regulator [Mycoemilia scoparia]
MNIHGLEFDGVPIDDDGEVPNDVESITSLVDEDVDFDFVYALFEFPAMVEGQVTVHQGEKMVLLDDSNAYWWLVQLVSNDEIGFIPADNVEMAGEKLARVNRRRNLKRCLPASQMDSNGASGSVSENEDVDDDDEPTKVLNDPHPKPIPQKPKVYRRGASARQRGLNVKFFDNPVTASFEAYTYSDSENDSDNDMDIPGYIADDRSNHHHNDNSMDIDGEDDVDGDYGSDNDYDDDQQVSNRQRRRVSATVPQGILGGNYYQNSIEYGNNGGNMSDDEEGDELPLNTIMMNQNHQQGNMGVMRQASNGDSNARSYNVSVTFHSPDPYESLERDVVRMLHDEQFAEVLLRLHTLFDLSSFPPSHCGLFVQINSATEAYPVVHNHHVSSFLEQLVKEFELDGEIPYEGDIAPNVLQLHLKLYPDNIQPGMVSSPNPDESRAVPDNTTGSVEDGDDKENAGHHSFGQNSKPLDNEHSYDDFVSDYMGGDDEDVSNDRYAGYGNQKSDSYSSSNPHTGSSATPLSSKTAEQQAEKQRAVPAPLESLDDHQPPSSSSSQEDNSMILLASTSTDHLPLTSGAQVVTATPSQPPESTTSTIVAPPASDQSQQSLVDSIHKVVSSEPNIIPPSRNSGSSSLFSNRNSLILDDSVIISPGNKLADQSSQSSLASSSSVGPAVASSRARHVSIQPLAPPRNSVSPNTRPVSMPFDHVPVLDGKEPPVHPMSKALIDSREVVKNMLRRIPRPKSRPPASAIAQAKNNFGNGGANSKRKSTPAGGFMGSPQFNGSNDSLPKVNIRPRSEMPPNLSNRRTSSMISADSLNSMASSDGSVSYDEKQRQRMKALNAICNDNELAAETLNSSSINGSNGGGNQHNIIDSVVGKPSQQSDNLSNRDVRHPNTSLLPPRPASSSSNPGGDSILQSRIPRPATSGGMASAYSQRRISDNISSSSPTSAMSLLSNGSTQQYASATSSPMDSVNSLSPPQQDEVNNSRLDPSQSTTEMNPSSSTSSSNTATSSNDDQENQNTGEVRSSRLVTSNDRKDNSRNDNDSEGTDSSDTILTHNDGHNDSIDNITQDSDELSRSLLSSQLGNQQRAGMMNASKEFSSSNPNRTFGHRRSNSLRRISVQKIQQQTQSSSFDETTTKNPTIITKGLRPQSDVGNDKLSSNMMINQSRSLATHGYTRAESDMSKVPTPANTDESNSTDSNDLPLDDWLVLMRGMHNNSSSNIGGANDSNTVDDDENLYSQSSLSTSSVKGYTNLPTPSSSPESDILRGSSHCRTRSGDRQATSATYDDDNNDTTTTNLTKSTNANSNNNINDKLRKTKSMSDTNAGYMNNNSSNENGGGSNMLSTGRNNSGNGMVIRTSSYQSITEHDGYADDYTSFGSEEDAERQIQQLRQVRTESQNAIEAIMNASGGVSKRLDSLESELDRLVYYLVQVV